MSGPARHVAILLPDLKGGGTQRVATTLANALFERGWRVDVISLRWRTSFFPLDARIEPIDLSGDLVDARGLVRRLRGALRRWSRWRRYLREQRPDVVLAMLPLANVMAVFGTRGMDVPVVISERNDPAVQRLRADWEWLRRRTYRRADVVTANSAGALATIARAAPAARQVLVPNAVNVPTTVAPLASERPWFAAVGRLNRQKAFDVLLEAFARIAARVPDWDLRIAGTGPEAGALAAQATRLGIADRVHWHGQLEDPFPLLAGAGALVLPSRHEGVPNAMLEAMALGRAVIVSDASSGPLEYVTDGANGRVVAVDAAADLATVMAELADDPALRARLGAAARERVASLRPDAITEQWMAVLDAACVGDRPEAGHG